MPIISQLPELKVPPFMVKLAVPPLIPTRISVPAAAVGALMMGPDASAILTGLLIVGRPSGLQFVAVDQRLSPLPLSHDTAKALTVKESKTTETNIIAFFNTNYLTNFLLYRL
jgi:hypothetical protein